MERGYYAIVPASVRYDNDLSPNAKLLYGEITALCNERGYCWASNSYFSKLYNKDKSTVARWLKQLEEKGYINRQVIYKEGSQEIEQRYMQICNEGIGKNATTPIGKNAIDNITSFNTTSNNNVPYKEIVDYFNKKTGRSFKHTSGDTKKHLKARWNENFTIEDFKAVIDYKYEEWKDNEKMSVYIRPSTFFNSKNFENYLNQARLKKQPNQEKRNQFESDSVDLMDELGG